MLVATEKSVRKARSFSVAPVYLPLNRGRVQDDELCSVPFALLTSLTLRFAWDEPCVDYFPLLPFCLLPAGLGSTGIRNTLRASWRSSLYSSAKDVALHNTACCSTYSRCAGDEPRTPPRPYLTKKLNNVKLFLLPKLSDKHS